MVSVKLECYGLCSEIWNAKKDLLIFEYLVVEYTQETQRLWIVMKIMTFMSEIHFSTSRIMNKLKKILDPSEFRLWNAFFSGEKVVSSELSFFSMPFDVTLLWQKSMPLSFCHVVHILSTENCFRHRVSNLILHLRLRPFKSSELLFGGEEYFWGICK